MKEPKDIPSLFGKCKNDIIHTLLSEEYGFLPEVPIDLYVIKLFCDENFCAGKASLLKLKIICKFKNGEFTFPIKYVRRKSDNPNPCFIHINFRDNIPDKYQPTEELVDNGYSIITLCYTDITTDDDDFTNGLAGVFYKDGKRNSNDCGKIGLWAWAAMRVMDYALTLPEIDHGRISVVGHSRLGKTALLAGALDERFYCAFSNDSGCCGAAISRNKKGETLEKIWKQFPFWFCEKFKKYVGKEDCLPFDQHFLIAANYPHRVYVSSAGEDLWADPEKEYLSCFLASSYFEHNGAKTYITEKMPRIEKSISKGFIGYHIRNGNHYFSREDWIRYIEYLKDGEQL